jgi:glutamate---cysteine ligase / carboxylate-amine ligase
LLIEVSKYSGDCLIDDKLYLSMFGYHEGPVSASGLWSYLNELLPPSDHDDVPFLATILSTGSLSKRLIQALGSDPTRENIIATYNRLCDCLSSGKIFLP